MQHVGLGELASACAININTLKLLTDLGYIPVIGAGGGTGRHRRFDIEGIVAVAAISALIEAGIGKIQAARLVQSIREHTLTRHLMIVQTQFLDGEWVNGPAREWHATDLMVDIVDGRFIFSTTPWQAHGIGEPVILGKVYGDLHGRGEDIFIREMQGGDRELDWARESRRHPRTLLRVNLSFSARWVMRRLLSNANG